MKKVYALDIKINIHLKLKIINLIEIILNLK